MAKDYNIYEANETMRILGKQQIAEYIGDDAAACEDFVAVMDAHSLAPAKGNDLFSVGIDFFMLGMIYGRRAERAKRQGKELKPLTMPDKVRSMAAELRAKPYLMEFMNYIMAADITTEQLAELTAILQEAAQQQEV